MLLACKRGPGRRSVEIAGKRFVLWKTLWKLSHGLGDLTGDSAAAGKTRVAVLQLSFTF
jgi:hypothetical protein